MSGGREEIPVGWQNNIALAAGALLAMCIALLAGTGLLLLAFPALGNHGPALPLLISAGTSSAYAALIFGAANVVRFSGVGVAIVMALSAICAAAAALVWTPVIWDWLYPDADERPYALGAISLTILSVALLHNGGMTRLFTRSPGLKAAKYVACAAVAIPAVLLSCMMWAQFVLEFQSRGTPGLDFIFSFYGPLLFIILFFGLVGSASLAMLIRHHNRKWEEARETISQKMSLNLECPKCGSAQSLKVGSAACASCGVLLNIELEEPRCECGYLLFKLASATCPECGRDVAEHNRWRTSDDEGQAEPSASACPKPQEATS